ncbi:PucR family transcriptional regulator [Bacillus sp. FJAT-26390]|uniref:PucR family transcriptional regulator n=1 Tax=Bacillus sp. FJAT-26390 TaxID=1743142 RepID=UPI000807C470|nr:PucR family transcriptional regulator [Bacillus sp. FJAT-26390]OBZ13410.1 CdaR family transcriptional regulator [Bacillus sp. FJAT-26390]
MVKTVLQLTVKEILERPLFHKAEAIASEEALNRIVKWVHIMEVTQVGHLLNGHELILCTGIGWHDDEALSLLFLQQLIDSGASGLCIELGQYAKQPFDKMKALAKRESFPLIFFHEEVRYIDITQDLHAYFIHQHHRMVSELETLSTELNQLLLSGKGMMSLLRLLHQTTGAQVAFFPLGAEPHFVPHMPRAKADSFYEQWIYGKMFAEPQQKRIIAHRPILALDHLFADLLLQSKLELSEFQILALDRAATAIAQEMMRTKHMEERRRHKEDLWSVDWLSGKHSANDVQDYIRSLKPVAKLTGVTVILFDFSDVSKQLADKDDGNLLIQKNMVARAIFEGEGLLLLPLLLHDHIVFIVLDQLSAIQFKERLLRAIHRLQKTEQHQEAAFFSSHIGIGSYIKQLTNVQESYETAKETLAIQKDIGPLPSPFYGDLHLHKIIYTLKKADALPALMEEYIGPVVASDQEKNGHLLQTLNVYLRLSGSKQETAKALFIARQTLYHRLDKLAALLGDDFMEPKKRLTIELALRAYEYVHGPII